MNNKKSNRRTMLVILLTVFLDLVGFSIIFPLFPDMLEYYLGNEAEGGGFAGLIALLERLSGLSGTAARFAATVLFGGILGSLYSILQFITAPIWGSLSDRHGRRRILIITVAGTAVSYFLWIVADAFWLLIASRLLGGAMAGNLSVATAAVADVTDASSRAKGMGLIGAAFGVGFTIGPALGGWLSQFDVSQTWSAIPGINPFSFPAMMAFILAALNLVLVIRIFPETRPPQTAELRPARRPLNPVTLFRPRPFPGVNRCNILLFVFIAAFAGMEFTLTFLAKDRFDYTAAQNGLLFLFIGVVIVIVQGGLVRRLAPAYGEKNLVIAGILLVLPGLVVVGRCQSELWLYAGLFLLAFGSSLVTPSLHALVSLFAPADRQGEILGIFRSLGALARAFAPLTAALVYWRFGSHWPYYGSALVMLIPLVVAIGLPRVRKMDD